jgi:hypothetical protein
MGTLHRPFEVISSSAVGELRNATSLQEKHEILREVFLLDHRYPTSHEAASSNAMRQDVLLELFTHLFTFAVGASLDDAKTSVLFALVQDAHTWACRQTNMVPCYEYFETLLLNHSIHRPPTSMAVFTAADVHAISAYFLENYVKFLPMYQYVFAVARELVLDVRRSLAEPAPLDHLVSLDCAVAYTPAEACAPVAAADGVLDAAAHPHAFILMLDTQETVSKLCAEMPVAPRLAPPLPWSAPPAYPRPDPAPVLPQTPSAVKSRPTTSSSAAPGSAWNVLPPVALPSGGALTPTLPEPSVSAAAATRPASAAPSGPASALPFHPVSVGGVPVAPSAEASALRAHALLAAAGLTVQPPRAPPRSTGFSTYPTRSSVDSLLKPVPESPRLTPEEEAEAAAGAAKASKDAAAAAYTAAAASSLIASPLAAALNFPVPVPVPTTVLSAHRNLSADDQALVGAALRRELAALATKFDAAARTQEEEYGRRIAALEEAAAQAQAQLAAAGVAAPGVPEVARGH